MTQAIFRGGSPVMVDYTPSGAVTAGDIVVVNGMPMVAHLDIAANELGALAIFGGIYDLIKDDDGGPAIAFGEQVAWIDGSDLATDVITSNTHFGVCVADAGATAAVVRTFHHPNGRTTNTAT